MGSRRSVVSFVLTRLQLTNYQSHKDTSLELGSFTVIVGPSSSGKSAVARALRLLVSNASGTTYVRHGAKRTRVAASFSSYASDPLDAQIQVAVERGSGVSRYELVIPGEDLIEFTKCGRGVPEAVQCAHDLGADELWVAGQFDRPFLLDETGSAVARTLGDLTNVSMIFAAVRECNRQASAAKTRHTDRTETLSRVRDRLRTFTDLPAKLAACGAAESALALAQEAESRRERLAALCLDMENAHLRVQSARAQFRAVPDVASMVTAESRRSRLYEMVRTVELAAARRAAIIPVIPPDVSALRALSERRDSLRTKLTEVLKSELLRRHSVLHAASAGNAAKEAHDRLSGVLTEAGMCPVCGASAEHARLDRVAGISH